MSPGSRLDTRLHDRIVQFAGLPLRLMVGFGFLMHGLAKWSRGPDVFVGVLHSLGVPAPQLLAWGTIVFEIVGGVAFLLGAFVWLVSIPATIVLLVAIVTIHLPFGFSSIKLVSITAGKPQFGPPGYECALLYITCIGVLGLTGPGAWSVDALLRPRRSSGDLNHKCCKHQSH